MNNKTLDLRHNNKSFCTNKHNSHDFQLILNKNKRKGKKQYITRKWEPNNSSADIHHRDIFMKNPYVYVNWISTKHKVEMDLTIIFKHV